MSMRPIGIDLFSGAGGLSLGFEQAGFDIVAAVEIDPVHAAIHKYNFPKCAVIPTSVADLSAQEIRQRAGIGNRPIEVVFGGPPCQGFSLMGQRALDDPRNTLVNEFARLVSELNANYFVFENVKGLTVGKHRGFLDELIDLFSGLGYKIRLPWRVLNASSYGVPQDRERLILIGTREGHDLPDYPAPTSRHPSELDLGLPPCPTCKEALGDLPDADDFPELSHTDQVEIERYGEPSAYASELRCEDNSGWWYGYRREWDPFLLTSSRRTRHTSISQRRFRETEPGKTEPISRFFRLPPDGISNTLRAGTDASRGAFTSPRPIHYEKPRCITVREMARLHGFPDWFRFHRTKWHGARQIGNAVPPPLARAIAASVSDAAGRTPTETSETLARGETALLNMDMSQAAAYWNVKAPNGRRDRKSVHKKRKQSEIEDLRIAK